LTGLFIWTAFGLAGTLALVWMVRRGRGARDERIRVADWLTIARLVLIAPTAWLLVHHHFIAAAICYTVLGTTDVIDGMIARARRETSAFGMFLDPLADILSTAAVYTLFVLDFSSTIPGIIVGVLQGAAALWIMAWAARGVRPIPWGGPLFAFLAVGFVSIVVSQTVIGYRHVRRAPRRARG